MIDYYECLDVTFDGVPFDHLIGMDYAEDHQYGCDVSSLAHKSTCSISIECTGPAWPLDNFVDSIRREPPGASSRTLARRARYGGRKGRRALRRLFNYAMPIEVIGDLLRFTGKAVWLNQEVAILRGRADAIGGLR